MTSQAHFDLTLFTDDPGLAAAADLAGVDRIGVDLEILGKECRQGELQNWISHHKAEDLLPLRSVIGNARLFARCNPMHADSQREIEQLLDLGVEVLMLPYFQTLDEAVRFIRFVDERAYPVLLVETAEAAGMVQDLCRLDGVEEIHFGLNDLRLSLGWPSHFHVLVSDMLRDKCAQVLEAGVRLGVGGVGRVGDNDLPIPADLVSARIVNLGASASLISRVFFRQPFPGCLSDEVGKLRAWLRFCAEADQAWHQAMFERLIRALAWPSGSRRH